MVPTMEQEILQQEEQLAEAKRALDLGAIDRMYADDLVLTGVMGEPTCSKTAIIDEIKRGVAERESARASGQQLEMSAANEDMKVVRHGDFIFLSSFRVLRRGNHITKRAPRAGSAHNSPPWCILDRDPNLVS